MAVKVNARKMRHRITIQERIRVSDNQGGYTETYIDRWNLPADIETSSYSKTLEANQVNFNSAYKIRMRIHEQISITPSGNRIKYKGRLLTIQSVVNVDEMDKVLGIVAYDKL